MKSKKIKWRCILLNKNLSLKNKNSLNKYFFSHNGEQETSIYKKIFNLNNNKPYHEYNINNNLSTKSSSQNKLTTFIDLNKSKYETTSNYSTINNISTINGSIRNIMKNFEQNKNSTKMLLKREKNFQINSLNNMTERNIEFLLSNDDYINGKNNNNKTINNEKDINRLSFRLIKLFNTKTNEILNKSDNSLQKYSKEKYQFSKDLTKDYKKIEFNEETLKKLKQKYYEVNDIIEQMNENKIKKAKSLEKEFYKLKNDEYYNKMKNKDIISLNNEFSKKRKNILSLSKIEINSKLKNSLKERSFSVKQPKNIKFKKNEDSKKEDRKLLKANITYNKYINKKIKLNAELFDKVINKLIFEKNQIKHNQYLDETGKKIKMIYKDLLKAKEFNKLKSNFKGDEYKNEYNKLKKGMNKCEDEYYRVCVFNNKNFKLSFLKPILKLKTIKKFLRIQDSNFGIP